MPPAEFKMQRVATFENLTTFLASLSPGKDTVDALCIDPSGSGGFVLIYH